MSDFKIKPPGGQEQVAAPDNSLSAGEPPEVLDGDSQRVETSPVEGSPLDPSQLIEQLRNGEMTFDQAVEALVEQALASQPIAVSDTIRGNIRNALIEMVRDDPTLSALASAMKR